MSTTSKLSSCDVFVSIIVHTVCAHLVNAKDALETCLLLSFLLTHASVSDVILVETSTLNAIVLYLGQWHPSGMKGLDHLSRGGGRESICAKLVQASSELTWSLDETPASTLICKTLDLASRLAAVFLASSCQIGSTLPVEPIADLDACLKRRGYRKVAALFGSLPHLQEATT